MGLFFSGSGDTQQNAPRKGSVAPPPRGGTAQVQAEAFGPAPQLLLHGCQVPRMLQDHHSFQPRPDCRPVRRMLHRSLPTDRWKGEVNGRLLLQEEATLNLAFSERRFHLVTTHLGDNEKTEKNLSCARTSFQPAKCGSWKVGTGTTFVEEVSGQMLNVCLSCFQSIQYVVLWYENKVRRLSRLNYKNKK